MTDAIFHMPFTGYLTQQPLLASINTARNIHDTSNPSIKPQTDVPRAALMFQPVTTPLVCQSSDDWVVSSWQGITQHIGKTYVHIDDNDSCRAHIVLRIHYKATNCNLLSSTDAIVLKWVGVKILMISFIDSKQDTSYTPFFTLRMRHFCLIMV